MNISTEFRIFELVLVPNFSLNWQFWFYEPDLPRKGFSGLKQKKWTPSLNSAYSNYYRYKIWFFGSHLPKKVLPVKNRKSEHRHGILHTWISLCTKFQLKLIILNFWTQFIQKGYFQSKTEQEVWGLRAFTSCVVKVNSTVVFENFEDLKHISLFWTFWKRNWLSFASWTLFILKLYKAFQAALCR